ncbi:MAG: outer membrane protein assembly factor BamB family protein [Planctomycetota bacterium]|jgi:outer membrane protein assembly factor BamB
MKIATRSRRALIALVVAALLASCAAPSPPTEGGAARVGPRSSKLSPSNAIFDVEPLGLKVLWSEELGQLSSNRQLRNVYAVENMVVIEAEKGEVHCLDSTTGIWQATTVLRDVLTRPPAAMGTTLFFITDNSLYAFDTAADTLSRPHHPGFAVFTRPLVFRDSLVLAGGSGELALLALPGEKQTWLASLGAPIFQQPVIDAARLYASAAGDTVIAVDLEEQRELWRWRPQEPSEISSGVAISGSRVFVGDNRGLLYSLQAEFGEPIWQSMLEAPVVGKPQIVGSRLLAFTNKPSVVCLEAASERKKLWQYDGAEQLLAASEEVAYLLTHDHSVAALSLESGQELWREPLPHDARVAGEPTRPAFFIADTGGSIVALAALD